jgi:hypothetical protein
MHIHYATPDLPKDRLSYLKRERWIILHQSKQIGRETFVYDHLLILVIVNVSSQVRVIAKLFFELD